MARIDQPKADVDRLYIPRKKGGRGLIQLELSTENNHHWTRYIPLETLRPHVSTGEGTDYMYIKKLYSTRREAENHQKALDVPDLETAENESVTADVKRAETKAKQQVKVKLPKYGKRNLCMGNTLLELKRQMSIVTLLTSGL